MGYKRWTSHLTVLTVLWLPIATFGIDKTFTVTPDNFDVNVVTLNPLSSWNNGTSGGDLTGPNTARGTIDSGATFSYSFIGDSTTITGTCDPAASMLVMLDGKTQTVDIGANAKPGSTDQTLFSASDLPLVLHTITVSPDPGGLLISSISWTFPGEMPTLSPAPNETTVTLEANSSGIAYSFNDWVLGDVGKSQQGVPYAMSTNTPNATFTYLYNGTGTAFFGDTDHQQFISVYVDNLVQPVDVFENDTSGLFIRPLFAMIDLPFATHNVTVVNTGVLYISTISWLASADGTSAPKLPPGADESSSGTNGAPNNANSPNNPLESTSSRSRIGSIIGGVIGGLVVVLIMFIAGYKCARRNVLRHNFQRSNPDDTLPQPAGMRRSPRDVVAGSETRSRKSKEGSRSPMDTWGQTAVTGGFAVPERPEAAVLPIRKPKSAMRKPVANVVPTGNQPADAGESQSTYPFMSYASFPQHEKQLPSTLSEPATHTLSDPYRFDVLNFPPSSNTTATISKHQDKTPPRSLPPPPRQPNTSLRNSVLTRSNSRVVQHTVPESPPPDSIPGSPESDSVSHKRWTISPVNLDASHGYSSLSPSSLDTLSPGTDKSGDATSESSCTLLSLNR